MRPAPPLHRSRFPTAAVLTAAAVAAGCGSGSGTQEVPPPEGLAVVGAGVAADPTFAPHLRASRADLRDDPLAGTPDLSASYRIEAEYQPGDPVRVALPVDGTLPRGAVPVVIAARGASGPWEPLPAHVSTDGRHVTFATPHFSFFSAKSVDPRPLLREIKEIIDGATSNATAEAKPPRCADEAGARSEGFSIASAGPDTLKWCFGREGGRRVLRVVNARRYNLVLSHPGARTIDSPDSPLLDLPKLARIVAGSGTVVPPRGEVTYAVDGPARVNAEFDGAAQSLLALQYGVELAVQFRTKFGGDQATHREKLVASMFGSKECVSALGQPGDAGALIKACFGVDTLTEAFGVKGLAVGAVMSSAALVEFLRAELNALGDQFNGRDRYAIRIRQTRPPVLGSPSFVPNGDGWGEVSPTRIYNGGVPSGLAVGITWRNWGAATARGSGRTSIYMPHGGYYPGRVPVEFEATRLARCPGEDGAAYTRLRVRAPDAPGGPLGDWSLWGLDLCSWDAKAESCDDVGGAAHTDDVTTDVRAWDTSCATAERLATEASNVRLRPGSPARYRRELDGFVCRGSSFDDSPGMPSITWSCLRGTSSATFSDY